MIKQQVAKLPVRFSQPTLFRSTTKRDGRRANADCSRQPPWRSSEAIDHRNNAFTVDLLLHSSRGSSRAARANAESRAVCHDESAECGDTREFGGAQRRRYEGRLGGCESTRRIRSTRWRRVDVRAERDQARQKATRRARITS